MKIEKYLNPTPFIDCDTGSVREKSQALTEGLETEEEKAIKIFYFVQGQVEDPGL